MSGERGGAAKRSRLNATSDAVNIGVGANQGSSSNPQDKNVDYLCPICFELLREAHMTKCGHTFCYECLLQTIDQTARCPKCNYTIDSQEHIFPNFLLNELVSKYKASMENQIRSSSALSHPELHGIKGLLTNKSDAMSLSEVDFMLNVLQAKRQQLAAHSILAQQQLLREFLQHLKKQKDEQLFALQREASVIQADLDRVDHVLREFPGTGVSYNPSHSPPQSHRNQEGLIIDNLEGENSNSDTSVVPSLDTMPTQPDGFNILKDKTVLCGEESSLPQRRQRMHHHFEDLVSCYTSARISQLYLPEGVDHPPDTATPTVEPDRWVGLDDFASCLSKLTRYNSVRPLATLAYTTDMFNNSSIVSSIEFDKDQEFFAIAGVTKRIKIYDYSVVLKDMVDIHYPSIEMVCSSKISCISWSSFHKGMLASSDYEGTVIVWDSTTAQKTTVFQEHEKRCWSVDFNLVDTKLIASGSDDARVKLWSTNISHSVASLEAKANVCCVKFNPASCYHLAFGSADHCVHYYDLRSTKQPLNVFKGHRKAVSYVKFLNSEDIVSASTDSQLKLWNINKSHCLRSFTGHVNEKNFVGLATDGDYVTCGSENNGLYVYYKGLSKHLFQFKFDAVRSFLDRDRKEEEVNEFVSAVCWKQNSNVMVAANSQGTIKVLELV